MDNSARLSHRSEIIRYIRNRKSVQSDSIENFYFDNPKFFIGKLVKYSTTTKKFSPISISQKNYTVSVNCKLNIENQNDPLVIDNCNLSNIRVKKNEISGLIKEHSYDISAQSYQVKSIQDFMTQCGILFYGDAFKFLNSFEKSIHSFNTNVICIIKFQYYSIDTDYNDDLGIYTYLKDNVTLDKIKRVINEDEIPLFISSEKHGRMLMLSIQTNKDYNELQNNLRITKPNFLNLNRFIKDLSELEDVKIEPYMIGCKDKSILQINSIESDAIIKELFDDESLDTVISYSLSNLSDNSEFGFPNNCFNIKILYVVSDKNPECINFNFLEDYRKQGIYFDMVKLKQSEFNRQLIKNEQYLSHFNILMLGGIDGKRNYSDFNDNIVQIINSWRLQSGFVLFLHDFIVGSRVKAFAPMIRDLEFLKECTSSKFEKVEISGNYKSLLTEPYTFTSAIDVKKTHESAQYSDRYIIVNILNNPKLHYYCENLERGVGDLTIGHYSTIAQGDEMLFVDIIIRIMKLRCTACQESHNESNTNETTREDNSNEDSELVEPSQSLNDNFDEDADNLSDL